MNKLKIEYKFTFLIRLLYFEKLEEGIGRFRNEVF